LVLTRGSPKAPAVCRNRCAVAEIAVDAPVEFGDFDLGARGANNFQRLGDYLLADTVARDDGDAFLGMTL
jgi:hypothetical protein